jgi:hypothetical protein
VCVCDHSLVTVHQEADVNIDHQCGRHTFCPYIDKKNNIDIQCWKDCKYYTTNNKVCVICYNCNQTVKISLPRGKIWITPGDTRLTPSFAFDMGIKSDGISIKNIKFRYDGTYITTEKVNEINKIIQDS